MATILFFGSLIGMCVLIGWRIFELKIKKIEAISNMWSRGDRKIHGWLGMAVYDYNHLRKIVKIFFSEFLPAYAYEVLTKLKDYVSKKYYHAGDNFRGRRVLRTEGSVSFFLQKITEEKEASGKMNN